MEQIVSSLLILAIASCNLLHRMYLLPVIPMGFDSWGHLYFVLEKRRASSGPFAPIKPRVSGGENFHYPFFVHWLYGFLPEIILRRYLFLVNPCLETIFLLVFLFIIKAANVSDELIVLTGIGYIFTPLWFSKAAFGPRVLTFTTRLVSEVAYPLALGIVLFDVGLPIAMAILMSAMLFATILLSSKFGVQAVFFVTPLTAVLGQSWPLAVAGVLGVAAAWFISRGAFGNQLLHQGRHLAWFMGELRSGRAMVNDRNKFSDLVPRSWRPTNQEIKKIAFGLLGRNSFTAVLIKAPHLVITAFLIAFYGGRLQLPTAVWAPTVAVVVIYLVINIPWLLFLGEAERYISHVSIFTNLMFATLCCQVGMTWLAILVGAYGLTFSVAERLVLRKPIHPQREIGADAATAYLKGREDIRMVLSIPYSALPPFRILADTQHGAVYSLLAGADHQRDMKALENHSHIDFDQWDRVVDVTGVDFVVTRPSDFPETAQGWQPRIGWQKVSGDFGDLALYERLG
jgi:hypothetical protein